MALRAERTEAILDKATKTFQTGFGLFNKMVFLNEDQQDIINTAVTNFEIYNKMITSNVENIEETISKMTDVNQVKEFREAVERLKKQEMRDTAEKVAAGEDVGITQMKQFSDGLMLIRKGIQGVEAEISMSFDDLINIYAKQITSGVNSDKAQEMHFRSLTITMGQQAKYLEAQIKQMDKQNDLNEEQAAILEANMRDLEKIKQFSQDTAVFSKMGPEELKKNKDVLNDIVGRLSDQTFESKMFNTMNNVDNSIQSLSVDSENLNNTMEFLSESQTKGKEMVAGTARDVKKSAKGAISAMVLSSLGLGGLDEALGISEKFSELNLFGKEGLFGKGGLLSNINQMKGVGGVVGGGLAVAGAGAAGYAFGGWLKKKIDELGGEKDFLGSKAYELVYGDKEKKTGEAADIIKTTVEMSRTVEGADEAIKIMNDKIKEYSKELEDQWFVSDEEEQKLELMKKQRAALSRVRDKRLTEEKKQIQIEIENIPKTVYERNELQSLKEKKQSLKVKESEKVIEGGRAEVINVENQTMFDGGKRGIVPNDVQYLPKVMEDTTTMIINNAKEENNRLIAAQKDKDTVKVPIPAPSVPAAVDLNKSIDDPTLTIFNNDIFG